MTLVFYFLKKDANYSPWFEKTLDRFTENIQISANESFNHPLAAIFMVSTQNKNPVEAIKNMYNLQKYAEKYQLDTDIYQFVVLIHDNLNGKEPTE